MKKIENALQFTLILKNVDENTLGLEDALYAAHCDDALINFRNGTVFLDFNRKAPSFKEAIISAIKQVESTAGIIVTGVAPNQNNSSP